MTQRLITALVVVLAACVPVGILMAIGTGNSWWLWLSAPLLLFLS